LGPSSVQFFCGSGCGLLYVGLNVSTSLQLVVDEVRSVQAKLTPALTYLTNSIFWRIRTYFNVLYFTQWNADSASK